MAYKLIQTGWLSLPFVTDLEADTEQGAMDEALHLFNNAFPYVFPHFIYDTEGRKLFGLKPGEDGYEKDEQFSMLQYFFVGQKPHEGEVFEFPEVQCISSDTRRTFQDPKQFTPSLLIDSETNEFFRVGFKDGELTFHNSAHKELGIKTPVEAMAEYDDL